MPRSRGTFVKGGKIPKSPGRPRLTQEQKEAHKLKREFARQHADTFRQACESLLPKAVDRVGETLDAVGIENAHAHIRAFEALRDTVHGRPRQTTELAVTSLPRSFEEMLRGIPGVLDPERRGKFGEVG